MPNNNLVMDEAEMNAGASSLGMCSTNVSSASSGVPGKFSGATNSNMMNKSVGEVTKQLNLIGTSISGVQGIISKHSSEMFGYDRIMAKLADDIEIPTDFLANNSMEINTFNRSLLEKTDGTSVNEGQADHGFRDIDDSTISAEGLHDMGDDQTKEQKYDESSVIGKSILGNISNEGSQEQEYDDDSAVQKGVISDISGNTTQEQEFNDEVSVEKEQLENINKAETQEQNYDESSVIGKSILGNVNNNVASQEQQMVDNTASMASVGLNNIKTKEVKDDDEIMLQTQGMAAASYAGLAASEETKKTNKEIEEEMKKIDEKYNAKLEEIDHQ